MRLETRLLEYIDELAPPVTADDAIARRQSSNHSPAKSRTRRGGRMVPAWAYGLGALILVLMVALSVSLLLGDQSQVIEPTPSTTPDFFTQIAPGEFVELPDWPLSERTTPPMVWTGAELIAWGDGIYRLAGDGAAFDLAKGTWRVIAEAPISPRSEPAAVWTGTEMILWGGRVENSFYYDGAAYNPATDTWRMMPPAPVGFLAKDPSMVWTGDEAMVFGVMGNADTYGEYIGVAAYDPAEDSWRTLVRPPFRGSAWWTGESIVMADVGYDPEYDQMARYDLTANRWTMVDVGSSAAVLGVPGTNGSVSTFVNLPSRTGAPVQLIDSNGNLIAELPSFPGDPGVFGDEISAYGLWVGDEAVFEISAYSYDETVFEDDYQPEQIWALNPSTQTWRRLDVDTAFPRIDHSAVVAGDLLLMWNRPSDVYRGKPRACCVAPPGKGGSAYRVGTAPPD